MNFTEKLIADQAALTAELATLRETVAKLTDKLNPPKPAPVSPLGFGGGPVIDAKDRGRDTENQEEHMARTRRQAKAHQELEASYMADRKAGLSDGQWRDDCGLIRDREGKIVPSGKALEQQIAKAAEHDAAARREDIAWRRSVELPLRVNGYLPETDEADDAVISEADDAVISETDEDA